MCGIGVISTVFNDRGLREEEVDRFFTPQPGMEAAEPAFLLEPRADRRRGASGPFCIPLHLGVHLVIRRGEPLAPRYLIQDERALDRFARRVLLALAELLPVDVRPHRIDLLLDQTAHELLDAAIDLPVD